MSVSKTLTATINGSPVSIPVEAHDETSVWDEDCVEPDLDKRPVPLTPAQIAGKTWEDIWVGPGWTTEPTSGRLFSNLEAAWSGLAGLGITASDDLRINMFAGAAGQWNFSAVTDPDVGQAGALVVSGDERPGPGWTLFTSSRADELPTPDANAKGVLPVLASRLDPTGNTTTGERAKLAWVKRPSGAAHTIIVGLGAKNIQFRGIMTVPTSGDSHPVVYHVTMPSDPAITNIPEHIHFQQVLIDGGGVDFDHNNGCSFGIVVRANMCSITDSYVAGISGPAGRESKAVVHGAGDGFLCRNTFGQATGINMGAGFQSTSDRRVRARNSHWEFLHTHKEIQSTNGPYVSKGHWEAKGVDKCLIEGLVGQNITVGANAATSDASNTQLVGFKGFNDTLGVNAKSTNCIARFCIGDGMLKGYYVQHIGASGGYTSWGVQRSSIHDLLLINHGGEAGAASGTTFNPSGDVGTYENNSTIGTLLHGDDPDGSRRGSYLHKCRGITVVNNSPGTVPPPGGGEPVKHFFYLGDGGPIFNSTDWAITDIIGPASYWGMWGTPGGNVQLDPGGALENADTRYIAGGINAHAGDDWFQNGDMAQYLDANGMLTAAGATAWRSAAGLSGSDPICTQAPRRHPDGSTFTPAADKPGADVEKILALLGGTLANPGTNVKSPTILYP